MPVHDSVSSLLVVRKSHLSRASCVCRMYVAGNTRSCTATYPLRRPRLFFAMSRCSCYVLISFLPVPIPCTDVCCRFRSQLSRPESPSYDLQARISSSMIAPKGPPLHCGQITPNGSVERDRILAFKRRNSLHNPISVKHDIGNEPRSIRGPTMLKKRRHAPSSIKFENDFEDLSPKTEEKTAQGLEYHSWKLSAVEVECRHCSERKLLPCSYLKLSPSLVQSGILPRIPRLEGESPCCAKQAKHSNSEDWPISQTAVCA